MSKITDRIMGHAADNDGIEEFDNPLPDWWVGMFLFTIVWGVGYLVDYHFVSGRSQLGYYEKEMAAAKELWPQSDAAMALVFDDAALKGGAEVYQQTCAACHGAELGGGIGPSLVDATWIHGGEPEQIRATITNGVAAKGMPAWGPMLGPEKVAKVTAFVVTKAKEGGGAAAPAPVAGTPGEAPATAGGDAVASLSGQDIYTQNCLACHGADMKGLVGPNLVDGEWIHGGELAQIEAVITKGVPEKGMISWGPILGEEKVKVVAKFIHDKANGNAQ